MPFRDDSGYRERDGCWNCATMSDAADYDESGDYRCTDERRRPTKRHGCPRVAAGGFCKYHHKEA